MNKGKLLQILGEGNIIIPFYIYKNFKKLNLKMDEFVFLMYLASKGNDLDFNPPMIAKELNMDIMEVMGYVSLLADRGYISLDVKTSENDVLEEVINLNNFYDKLSTLLMDLNDNLEEPKEDVFKLIETRLGRTLNSLEISTINGWLANKVSLELIKEALKRAEENGISSIKHIDKLIFEWVKSGIKTVSELEKMQKTYKDAAPVDLELGDWNWLDDEEEYIAN